MAPLPHQPTQGSPAYPDLPSRNTEPVEQRLARMQDALGVPDGAVPASLRQELAHACAVCGSRTRCTRWLLFGGAAGEYREFCPNAARYDGMLRAHGAPRPQGSMVPSPNEATLAVEHAPAIWALLAGLAFSTLVWATLFWAYWGA